MDPGAKGGLAIGPESSTALFVTQCTHSMNTAYCGVANGGGPGASETSESITVEGV